MFLTYPSPTWSTLITYRVGVHQFLEANGIIHIVWDIYIYGLLIPMLLWRLQGDFVVVGSLQRPAFHQTHTWFALKAGFSYCLLLLSTTNNNTVISTCESISLPSWPSLFAGSDLTRPPPYSCSCSVWALLRLLIGT